MLASRLDAELLKQSRQLSTNSDDYHPKRRKDEGESMDYCTTNDLDTFLDMENENDKDEENELEESLNRTQ